MYYELMTKPIIQIKKREYILQYKKEILEIVTDMLQLDAPTNYVNYNIYKECFITFSQDIIEKYKVLNAPTVEYMIDDAELVDKQIFIRPKSKTIIECMKKYQDNV